MVEQTYQIAAGWDNTAGFTNIEAVSVSGGAGLDTLISFLDTGTHYFVQALGNYVVPYAFTTAGTVSQNGFKRLRWRFSLMEDKALDSLLTTYAQESSNDGNVTVSTRLHTATYVSKNAKFFIKWPDKPPLLRSGAYWYQDVETVLKLLEGTPS